jgi:hypothetical protein
MLNVVTVLAGWVEVAVVVNDLSCVVVTSRRDVTVLAG